MIKHIYETLDIQIEKILESKEWEKEVTDERVFYDPLKKEWKSYTYITYDWEKIDLILDELNRIRGLLYIIGNEGLMNRRSITESIKREEAVFNKESEIYKKGFREGLKGYSDDSILTLAKAIEVQRRKEKNKND